MPAAGYRAPSVAKAMAILEMASKSSQGLGISQMARRLEISKGTISGICAQLEEWGALIRDPATKRYTLGPFVNSLADRGQAYARLRRAAGPELARLRDEFNQAFFLGVASGDWVAVLEAHQPSGVVSISAGPGTRLPITAGAVGWVFMAGLPPDLLDGLLAKGIPAYTARTIIDPGEIRRQVELARARGYALERDQYLMGVWGAAAALNPPAGLQAAVWSVGFSSAVDDKRLDQLALRLLSSAKAISRAMQGG